MEKSASIYVILRKRHYYTQFCATKKQSRHISRKEVHPHTINYMVVKRAEGRSCNRDAKTRVCCCHRDWSVTELRGCCSPFTSQSCLFRLNPDFRTLDILSAISMPLLNVSDRHYTNWLVKRVEKPRSNPSQWPYSLKRYHWLRRGRRTKHRVHVFWIYHWNLS